jgi:hypothetical protein
VIFSLLPSPFSTAQTISPLSQRLPPHILRELQALSVVVQLFQFGLRLVVLVDLEFR